MGAAAMLRDTRLPPRHHDRGAILAAFKREVWHACSQQRRNRYGEMELPPAAELRIAEAWTVAHGALLRRWRLRAVRHTEWINRVLARARAEVSREFRGA